jgi:GT2 family glycosyltransferase
MTVSVISILLPGESRGCAIDKVDAGYGLETRAKKEEVRYPISSWEAIDAIGLVDEGLCICFDDIDYCLNAKRAG